MAQKEKHRILNECCHAAHSHTQNNGFLSDENQHPIFIWGTRWHPREIYQLIAELDSPAYSQQLVVDS